MAFCKYCGKKLEDGEKCGCAESKTTKTTKKSEGFDFGKTMNGIKDDLFASIKNPIDVIEDNTDAEDMPKTYIMAAIIALTFGIFFAALMKNLLSLILDTMLAGLGSLVSDKIEIPYVKVILYGFIIFAITLLAYAVIMLVIPAIFKNKKIDFKKALSLTTAAYIPMIWANLIVAVLGFLNLDIRIVLAVYLIASIAVGYNFAYAYAKYTDIKPNKFGYAIATLVVLSAIISGVATYALSNSMTKSIAGDMTKIDDDLDW